MGKEKIQAEIIFWKEMFSYFSKLLVVIIAAVVADINTRGNFRLLDFLGLFAFVIFSIVTFVSILKWRKHIEELENGSNNS